MEKVEILLDGPTLERTRRLAQTRGYTVEALLKQIIEQWAADTTAIDPVLGIFADDPMLIDQVTEDAMLAREAQVLRHAGE